MSLLSAIVTYSCYPWAHLHIMLIFTYKACVPCPLSIILAIPPPLVVEVVVGVVVVAIAIVVIVVVAIVIAGVETIIVTLKIVLPILGLIVKIMESPLLVVFVSVLLQLLLSSFNTQTHI